MSRQNRTNRGPTRKEPTPARTDTAPRPTTRAARRATPDQAGPPSRIEEFRAFRERMNRRILETDNLEIRRFFALDGRAYQPGALPPRTKELLGLVASFVLRCDDCITYHLARCVEEGVADDELLETFAVGLVVGGSITIPHLRRAIATLDELRGHPTPRPPTAAE